MQKGKLQLITDKANTVHLLEFYKEEGLLRSRKLSAAVDIVFCLLLPIVLYSAANIVILNVKCTPWESTVWLLFAYIAMLLLAAIFVLHHKNKVAKKPGHEFVLSSDEIVFFFTYILFLNTLFFFIWGIREGVSATN